MVIVPIVQALKKGPCVANQIVHTDIGSADNLAEQGLDLRNTANKTLPCWLLPNLTIMRALKASFCPDAILLLPNTVCPSQVTTRSSDFQQLASKDKILSPNQWEVHLIEFNYVKTLSLILNFKKHKHSTACPHRQGYRDVKLHVILVGVMGTIYKDHTDKF
jgi:hypothetical protein